MNNSLEKRLLDLKEKFEKKDREVIQAEGALDQLRNQLKEEFGVDTAEAAEELLEGFTDEEKELETTMADKIEDIEGKYEL